MYINVLVIVLHVLYLNIHIYSTVLYDYLNKTEFQIRIVEMTLLSRSRCQGRKKDRIRRVSMLEVPKLSIARLIDKMREIIPVL